MLTKILLPDQIKQADHYTIVHEPVSSIDLMERAARACTNWLQNHLQGQRPPVLVFAGPGNNGGDGLAIARQLSELAYKVEVYILGLNGNFSADFQQNLDRLKAIGSINIKKIKTPEDFPVLNKKQWLIDALFGAGLNRPLDGLSASLVAHINQSRAKVVAIDLPSGLFASENPPNGHYPPKVIAADHTLTFEFPKLSFFFAEHEDFVGRFHILPIGLHPDFVRDVSVKNYLLTQNYVAALLKERRQFSHKGHFGHALLISGSYGKTGAAILSAGACLRSGVGLLSVHTPRLGVNPLQTACPEAMLSIDRHEHLFSEVPNTEAYSAIGVGPAIGRMPITQSALKKLIDKNLEIPLLLDADALNILSENTDYINKLPANSILTPHPKEFERLTGQSSDAYTRYRMQVGFAREHQLIIVLKGAYTSVALPDGRCFFNPSGNAGMATGGSGDVLTGLMTGLLAQGYSPKQAALLGVYLHGLSGDLALKKQSKESLLARDIVENMALAFEHLHTIARLVKQDLA